MCDFLHSPWGDVVLWLVTMGPFWVMLWWLWRRDRREAAERQRQYAVQQQAWDEPLSDEARESQRRARERAAELKCEARRLKGGPQCLS